MENLAVCWHLPTSAMDKLPTELHSSIASFTSGVDHGCAIQSLAFTSRYFHDVSTPYLYQVASISGHKAAAVFLQNLAACEPAGRFRVPVKRLFLADWTKEELAKHDGGSPMQNDDRALEEHAAEAATIQSLLTKLAPTLEQLTFVSQNPYNTATLLARIFAMEFPYLEDLSLHGHYPFPYQPSSAPPTMPNLRTLRLSGNANPHGIFYLSSLQYKCPNLEKIHFSGVESAPAFAQEICQVLTHDVTQPEVATRDPLIARAERSLNQYSLPTPLPRTLRHIHLSTVRQELTPSTKSYRTRLHARMTDILSWLVEPVGRKGRAGAPVVVLEESPRRTNLEIHELWLSGGSFF